MLRSRIAWEEPLDHIFGLHVHFLGHLNVTVAAGDEELVGLDVGGFRITPRLVFSQAKGAFDMVVSQLLHPASVRHEGQAILIPAQVVVVEPLQDLRCPIEDLLCCPEQRLRRRGVDVDLHGLALDRKVRTNRMGRRVEQLR